MAEMMIAIVILGLGMLMAATMFPIGWLRARDLADFTNSTAAAQAAATTVRLLTHVAARRPPSVQPPPLTESSFLGDFNPSETASVRDTIVHVLHVENMIFESDTVLILGEALLADTPPESEPQFPDYIPVDDTMNQWDLNGDRPPLAQIAFHERVFPPLPAYPPDDAEAEAFQQWEDQLANRLFAWAVLHKLDPPIPDGPNDPRSFTMYFVTLRRTQATHRFARQNPADPPEAPAALPADEDVLFPVPWLINLTVEGNWDTSVPAPWPSLDPTGVPSEAIANPTGGANGRLIARMLMPGSVLIDRLNGNVYTVKDHRFTGPVGSYDYRATVTLDREINVKDVDHDWDGPTLDIHPNQVVDVNPGNDEDDRDFWVFPPPVVRGVDEAYPVFDGQQPVVAIETRQMTFTP